MVSNQARSKPELTVEIDLFSGRPNPHWKPASGDVARIMQLLPVALKPTDKPYRDEPLGFRGFILTIGTATGRRRLHVHDGLVRSEQGWYEDLDHQLEKALATTLPADLKSAFGSLMTSGATP